MKPLSFFFIFVVALVLGLPSTEQTDAQPADSNASRATREGIEAGKAGNWDKAIESFKRAGESAPNNRFNLAVAYRQRGLAEIKKDNWDGAISDFSEALKRKEDDAVAHRFRGFAYLRKNDWQKALEDYDAVVKEKKNDTEALGRRAFVEMQLKEYDKAIADYSAVIKQQPKSLDGYLGRSRVYELAGKIDLALADVDAAVNIQPTNSDAVNRQKWLIAQKTKGQPVPAITPTLLGTPIPRIAAPSPAVGKPSSLSSPAASATASPH
jgi:tetratricopeptide (TPR) repeat protein